MKIFKIQISCILVLLLPFCVICNLIGQSVLLFSLKIHFCRKKDETVNNPPHSWLKYSRRWRWRFPNVAVKQTENGDPIYPVCHFTDRLCEYTVSVRMKSAITLLCHIILCIMLIAIRCAVVLGSAIVQINSIC